MNIKESKMILSIGQMIPGKGFDVLLRANGNLSRDIGVYVVDGTPDEDLQQLKRALHWIMFIFLNSKPDRDCISTLWHQIFLFFQRERIFGAWSSMKRYPLVCLLLSQKCITKTELVKDRENDYLVEADEVQQTPEKIRTLIESEQKRIHMGNMSRYRIR